MTENKSSRIQNFYKLNINERRCIIKNRLASQNLNALQNGGLTDELSDKLIENAIGKIAIPVGIATNFLINGKDYLIPMAVEEPSVIAAASNAAKWVRNSGGFYAQKVPSLTTAQIEIIQVSEPLTLTEQLTTSIIEVANKTQPMLRNLGGGVKEVRLRNNVGKNRSVLHLVVDCKDAMGANMVNTMAEKVALYLEQKIKCTCGLKILTNLADDRLSKVRCQIPFDNLVKKGFSGEQLAKGIVNASEFATNDPYRAATHNKGIFNGIDPVLLVTGNDWRAVEAGGHAYAARNGTYSPLATWEIQENNLLGQMTIPMAVGIVGGASKAHPCACEALEILGVKSACELAQIVSCCGLASNLAALAALSTEGIQAGHMRLHNKRI